MKSIGRNCVALLLALVSVAVAKASTVDTLAVESKAMNKKVILGKNKANLEMFSTKDKNNYFVEMGNPNTLAKMIYDISQNGEMNEK